MSTEKGRTGGGWVLICDDCAWGYGPREIKTIGLMRSAGTVCAVCSGPLPTSENGLWACGNPVYGTDVECIREEQALGGGKRSAPLKW